MKSTKMVRIEVGPHKLLDQDYFNEVIDLLNEVKNKYNYESHPRIVDDDSQKMVLMKQVEQSVAKVKPIYLHEVDNDVLYTASGKEIKPVKLTSGKTSKVINTAPSNHKIVGENTLKEFIIHYLKENGCYPTADTIRNSLGLTNTSYRRRLVKLVDLGKLEIVNHSMTGYRLPNYKYEQTKNIDTSNLSPSTVRVLNLIIDIALNEGYLPTRKHVANVLHKKCSTISYHFNTLANVGILRIYGETTQGKSTSYSINGLSAIRQAKNPIVNQLSYKDSSHQKESLMM